MTLQISHSTTTAQMQASGQRMSPTSIPVSGPKTAAKASSGQEELLKLLDQAETSTQEHFQQLRSCILQVHSLENGCAKPGDGDRKSVERLLQAERENMARQRALEQEQVRSTMQQLTEAWLKLEREQLINGGQQAGQQACSEYYAEALTGTAHVQQESGVVPESSSQAIDSGQSLTALGFQPASTASVDAGSKGSEELFHKLRSDLKKRASSRS